MLATQVSERADAAADPAQCKEDEVRLFDNIRQAADGKEGAPVPFKSFVGAIEVFFLGGADMHPDMRRGFR